MRLFPRLDDAPAVRTLVASLMTAGVGPSRERRSAWHPAAWHGAAGGEQVGEQGLLALATELTRLAALHGYPGTGQRDTRATDLAWAIHLYESMGITPVEATAGGIWTFLACVVVPDLVAWRFPARTGAPEAGNPDRWIVGPRSYRHAFGRLWWRACMLRDPTQADPWHLMRQLQEDEFIQLMERPLLVGYREAVLALVRAMLAMFHAHPHLNRGTLMRIAAKRLLRLGAVVDLHALDATGLHGLMTEIASGAVAAQETAHAGAARA